MNPSHTKILEILKQKPCTLKNLEKKTGLSKDGLRGRISELRTKHGYTIQKKDDAYHLIENKKTHADKLLSTVKEKNLFGIKIPIQTLREYSKQNEQDFNTALLELYKQNQLTQITKDIVIVFDI